MSGTPVKDKGGIHKMAVAKYEQYIVRAPVSDERIGRVAHLYGGKDFFGASFSPAWIGITEPLFMMKESHAHDYDEYLFFWGTNGADIEEFGAEVELCLGEEEEKHIITKPCIVYLPRGLKHCPLNFKVVNKPILFMDISISPEYKRS
jgi:hypothetical protein